MYFLSLNTKYTIQNRYLEKIELKMRWIGEYYIIMSTFLSDKFRNEVSWNGYTSDILKSGLQKYIRRNELQKALYCAAELDLFKHAQTRGETIRTNFLHRLMIIYLEDVENLTIFSEVDELFRKIFLEREKKDSRNHQKEEEWISKIVFLLCSSKKARICSHIRSIFNKKYMIPEIISKYPSLQFILEQIHKDESSQSVSLEFHCNMFKKYYNEKNILCLYYGFQIDLSEEKLPKKSFSSSKPVFFIFELMSTPFNKNYIMKYIHWYKEHLGTMREGFLCWLLPLLSYLEIIPEGTPISEDEKYDSMWDKNRRMEKIEIDEYVIDRHTRRGYSKGMVEFATNGAKVENEADFINPLWKQFYEDTKRFEEGLPLLGEYNISTENISKEESIKKVLMRRPKVKLFNPKLDEYKIPFETEEYEFIVLTQLVTGRSKQDVYFAKDKKNKLVVVKGPYSIINQIHILERNKEWKQKNNIPYLSFEIKQMIPNRWSEGIPLGIRNTVDRTKPYWFLIFDSVITEDQIQIKNHQSQVWPVTQVVDWDKIPLHFNYKHNLTSLEMTDYVKALLFRYVRGVSDLADRNFLRVEGRIISIDEEIEHKNVDLYSELKRNKSEYIASWLEMNYHRLDVLDWAESENRLENQRLKKIQNKQKCIKLFSPKSSDDILIKNMIDSLERQNM